MQATPVQAAAGQAVAGHRPEHRRPHQRRPRWTTQWPGRPDQCSRCCAFLPGEAGPGRVDPSRRFGSRRFGSMRFGSRRFRAGGRGQAYSGRVTSGRTVPGARRIRPEPTAPRAGRRPGAASPERSAGRRTTGRAAGRRRAIVTTGARTEPRPGPPGAARHAAFDVFTPLRRGPAAGAPRRLRAPGADAAIFRSRRRRSRAFGAGRASASGRGRVVHQAGLGPRALARGPSPAGGRGAGGPRRTGRTFTDPAGIPVAGTRAPAPRRAARRGHRALPRTGAPPRTREQPTFPDQPAP